MNYKRVYDSIMIRAQSRVKPIVGEKHHIVPKCLGGTNKHTNLAFLTPREHFLAHVLLTKIYPKVGKLVFALILMKGNPSKQRYLNSRLYDTARSKQVQLLVGKKRPVGFGENIANHLRGRPRPEAVVKMLRNMDRSYTQTKEFSQIMSDATKGKLNGMYGKRHSVESRRKMSEARRARRILKSA